jgi:hypothetical protein
MIDCYRDSSVLQHTAVSLNDAYHHLKRGRLFAAYINEIADFVKADPRGWLEMAEATCLQRDAKFKRLLAKKQNEAAKRGLVLSEQV